MICNLHLKLHQVISISLYIYFFINLVNGLVRKNEDPGLYVLKDIKEMMSSQGLLKQDVQSLRKEIVDLSDLIRNQLPMDCYTARMQGAWSNVLEIKPPGLPICRARCDQFTFGGGWTVVVARNSENYFRRKPKVAKQKHRDSLDEAMNYVNTHQSFTLFNRTWNEYRNGFGDPHTEYWIGNDVLHVLTKERPWEALVLLEDWNGNVAQGFYDAFRISDEESFYKLEISGYRKDKSNIGDGLSYHSGSSFSTFDADNDEYELHCAMKYGGGWWFHQCHVSFLTGTHLSPGKEGHHAVHWLPWKNSIKSLKKASLMIRPPVIGK